MKDNLINQATQYSQRTEERFKRLEKAICKVAQAVVGLQNPTWLIADEKCVMQDMGNGVKCGSYIITEADIQIKKEELCNKLIDLIADLQPPTDNTDTRD